MFVYLVECWSNSMQPDLHCPSRTECHSVHVAHIASSEKKARQWALKHLEYGGTKKKHPDAFFPWHFKIRQWLVDEDCSEVIATHDVQVGSEIHPRKYHKRNNNASI